MNTKTKPEAISTEQLIANACPRFSLVEHDGKEYVIKNKNRLITTLIWEDENGKRIGKEISNDTLVTLLKYPAQISFEVLALRKQNKELLEALEKEKRGFYMNICRAYNAGKQNQINIVLAKGSPDEDKMFLSSHEYFITEFPNLQTF